MGIIWPQLPANWRNFEAAVHCPPDLPPNLRLQPTAAGAMMGGADTARWAAADRRSVRLQRVVGETASNDCRVVRGLQSTPRNRPAMVSGQETQGLPQPDGLA